MSLLRVFSTMPRIQLSLPARTPLVLYDAGNSSFFFSQFPSLNTSTILHVRKEVFYLWIIFLALLEPLFWSGSRYSAYKIAFLRYCKPRLVLTMVDNHLFFYELKHHMPQLFTASVQNSRRSDINDVFSAIQPSERYKVDHMFVYSRPVGHEYQKYISTTPIELGSFKNNLHDPANTNPSDGIPDILFISQWRPPETFQSFASDGSPISYELNSRPFANVFEAIVKLCKVSNLTLSVLPVSLKGNVLASREHEFYRTLAPDFDFSFLPSASRAESYDRITSSRLTVTLTSTFGLEALARKQKTVFLNCRSNILKSSTWRFGWPADLPARGPFWTDSVDHKEIADQILSVLALSNQDWESICRVYGPMLMVHVPNNTPIRSLLARLMII